MNFPQVRYGTVPGTNKGLCKVINKYYALRRTLSTNSEISRGEKK
jgi:hypothetical protein